MGYQKTQNCLLIPNSLKWDTTYWLKTKHVLSFLGFRSFYNVNFFRNIILSPFQKICNQHILRFLYPILKFLYKFFPHISIFWQILNAYAQKIEK
jgi:hypothetical protein